MAEPSASMQRRDRDVPPYLSDPLPAAAHLSLSSPISRVERQRQYNSKEELAMSAAEPFDGPAASSPPVTFTTLHLDGADSARLASALSTMPSVEQPQLQRRAPSPRGAPVAQDSTNPLFTAREEATEDGGMNGDIDPSLPSEARGVKDFQCPRVPTMVLVLLVFTALVQGFSASAVSLFINMELKLGPVEVTRYWMYIGYTAWCQPAIGYLSDAMVLFGEKRRPLFILAAAGNTVIFFLYCMTPQVISTYARFVVLSIVSQFFTMGLYIPLNGLVVEVGRHDAETEEESTARMSAIMSKTMVWRSIGSLIGNILQTCLVVFLTVPSLLGVSGLLFFILVPIVLVTPRRLFLRAGTQDQNFYRRVAEAGRLVWRSFDIRDIRSDGVCFVLVLAFVFVYTMMPDAGSVYYNYLYGAYTFPAWFYSLNNCIGYLGSIAGAYVFSLWMDHRARQEASGGTRTSMFFVFMIGSFAWAFGYVTNLLLCTGFVTRTLGISAAVYVPVDNFFMSMFVRFAFMPTITMAAEHAPKFFEATTFEVFSVASIGGGTISSLLTSIIAQDLGITRADYSKLSVLIVISIVLKLVPIPLAYLLPERHGSVDEMPTIEGGDARAGEGEKAGTVDGMAAACAQDGRYGGAEGGSAGGAAAAKPFTQNEGSRISQDSSDECDPSVPLNRHHRNLI